MFNLYKLSQLARGLIYVTLFLPLLIVPSTIWEFVFIRNIVFYYLAALLVLLSLIYVYKNKFEARAFFSKLIILIAVFVAIRIASGFLGIDAKRSFWGTEMRMDGNLGYVALLGWLISLAVFLNSREAWMKFFRISVLVVCISGFFAAVQAFFPEEAGFLAGKEATLSFWRHRLIGTLGNPIFFSGYLLFNTFFALYLFFEEQNKRKKIIWLSVFAFLSAPLYLANSRGALLGFLAGLIFIGFFGAIDFFIKRAVALKHLSPERSEAACPAKLIERSGESRGYNKFSQNFNPSTRSGSKILSFFLMAVPILAAVLFFIYNSSLFSFVKTGYFTTSTASTRLILWKIGLQGALSRPIFGWGAENFSYIFSKFYNPDLLKFSFYETWADKPHNGFIEIAVASGIPGFALFLAIGFYGLYLSWKLSKAGGAKFLIFGGAIIAYAGHIFFVFDSLETKMGIFGIFGFLIFCEKYVLKKEERFSAGLLKAILIVLLASLLISLKIAGFGAIGAAYLANRANNALIANQYDDGRDATLALSKIKSPYMNENWEILADTVLKASAIGRIPSVIMRDLLPAVSEGLKTAALGNPNNFSYHYRLAQMYNLSGQYISSSFFDQAVKELEISRQISPERQVADLLLAQIFYHKRDVPSGIKILEDLVKRNQAIAVPYWYLGLFSEAVGDSDKAYINMVSATEKGYVLQMLNERIAYVTVLGKYKDYERMAPVYEQLTKDEPVNSKWWANLAATYLELKQYEKAKAAARQAILLDPAYGDEGEKFLRKIEMEEAGK